MTPEQALSNLDKVTQGISANRETHAAILESIRVLSNLIAEYQGKKQEKSP